MPASWNHPGASPQQDAGTPNVLIGAPYDIGQQWLQNLHVDGRFRVSATKTTIQELVVGAQDINPDAVLLNPGIFGSVSEVVSTVQRLQCDVYLVLPDGVVSEDIEAVREQPNVKSVYVENFNWPELLGAILANTAAKRKFVSQPDSELWRSNSGVVSAGMYNIAIWGRSGGAGRTSVAIGFAEVCAQRGIRTLLVSLAAPCPLPYMMDGLKASTNISEWFARPSVDEGFKNAVQTYKPNLDVIVGLQDAIKENNFMQSPDSNATINDLAIMAARLGYGAVIMDAPTSIMAGAAAAISAANYMVLVARPTIADIIANVEAFRLVVKNLSGRHMIKPGNVVCVLNQMKEGLLPQDDFHRIATEFLQKQDVSSPFPVIATTIKDDIAVPVAQNDGTSAITASEPFARGIHSLTGLILGAADKNNFSAGKPKKKRFGLF
ncbi:MAG: AAA family ATPase [Anaerolineaceae bacterium]|nr:AAA family ATPase [Anaerolineaceae bacterium]